MRLLIKLALMTSLIALSTAVSSDVRVASLGSAFAAALVYSLLVVLIGWLVKLFVAFLSIVPGILTFGLFFLLVPVIANALILKMTSGLLASFEVVTWTAAFALSIALSVLNALLTPSEKKSSE